jgi:hypothetical protein
MVPRIYILPCHSQSPRHEQCTAATFDGLSVSVANKLPQNLPSTPFLVIFDLRGVICTRRGKACCWCEPSMSRCRRTTCDMTMGWNQLVITALGIFARSLPFVWHVSIAEKPSFTLFTRQSKSAAILLGFAQMEIILLRGLPRLTSRYLFRRGPLDP